MHQLFGVEGPTSVGRLIEESAQLLNRWEVRGVSRRGALALMRYYDINPSWLESGEGHMLLGQFTVEQLRERAERIRERSAGAPVRPPSRPAGDGSGANTVTEPGDAVLATVSQAGFTTAVDLEAALGTQASEAAARLVTQGELLVAAGPVKGWVAPRRMPDVSSTARVQIFDIDRSGRPREFGALVPTTRGRYWMEELAGPSALHDGLPWFLQDMRPQGFLGHAFAAANATLQLPANPDHWNDDQILRALAMAGEDLPGSLIVGERSFERFLRRQPAPRVSPSDYPQIAIGALAGAATGSSAGGEHPKFACVRPDGVHVLVKFSPPHDTALGRRWADLLVCEHLALEQIAWAGVPAARSRIHQEGGRTFLEVERFDRTVKGRIGMVSLRAYDAEYVGQEDNWATTAARMQQRGLLTEQDALNLRFLELFGHAIANTDQHYGNISLVINAQGDWSLAPAYDQLPMAYAPVAGEVIAREVKSELQPSAHTLSVWEPAIAAGLRFWEAVAAHDAISTEFRQFARERHIPPLAMLASEAPNETIDLAVPRA